jgi:glycogen synthase
MRICLLSTVYPPYSTEGIARQRQLLANELVRQGHEVHVVTCGAGHFLRFEQGVWIHEIRVDRLRRFSKKFSDLDLPLTYSQALYEGLAQLAIGCPIDIVDVPLWAAQGFVTLRRYSGVAVVWLQTTQAQLLTINHQMASGEKRALLSLERDCLEQAHGWLADSQAVLKSINTDYGLRQSPPTAIALLGLPPLKGPVRLSRVARDEVVALVVGRLERRKGTPLLFQILPELLRQHPQLTIRFVGRDNSKHDGWYKQQHMTYPHFFRLHHPDLARRVLFEGYISDVQLNQAYQTSDFLIAPSLFESFGLVFVEAMRAALPVVTFTAGAAAEIFGQTESNGALLAAPYEAEQLAASIIRLVQQPELRNALGRIGHERFETAFTAEAMATRTIEFYQEIRQLSRTAPND